MPRTLTSVKEQHDVSDGDWADKNSLAASAMPFLIESVEEQVKEDGSEEWVVWIRVAGHPKRFSMSKSPSREQLLSAIQEETATGEAVGPVKLAKINLSGGRTMYVISELSEPSEHEAWDLIEKQYGTNANGGNNA